MMRLLASLRRRLSLAPLSKEQAEILASVKHPCC